MPNRILCYERIAALASVPNWQANGAREYIRRRFEFETSKITRQFIEDIIKLAKEIGHRAELSGDHYSVEVTLLTPEVGGLSELDMEMAQALDDLVLDKTHYRQ